MRDTYVSFRSGDIQLAGTIAVPDGSGPFPGFVLVHGGTPEDRDGNPDVRFGGYVVSKKPELRELAEALSSAGFAVLRYDKRGIGKSQGDYLRRTQTNLVDDVLAGVSCLRAEPRVDPQRIALFGHSEGVTVGAKALVRDTSLSGFVAAAGIAGSIREGALWHAQQAAKREGTSRPIEDLQRAIAQAEGGAEIFEWFGGQKESGAWLREFIATDMHGLIARVACPILFLQGDKDWHVRWTDALELAAVAKGAGNQDVSLALFANVDHLLKFEPGVSSPERYQQEPDRAMEPLVLRTLVDWAQRVLVRREPSIDPSWGQGFSSRLARLSDTFLAR